MSNDPRVDRADGDALEAETMKRSCLEWLRRLAAICAFAAMSTGPVQADSPTSGANTFDMLTNMGYDVKKVGQNDLTITANSYVVEIVTSGDNTMVYIQINYGVPADKAPKTPMQQMLTYNQTHALYYAISVSNGVTSQSSLIFRLPAPLVNPRALRTSIDEVTSEATAQQATLNPDNWR